MGEKDFERKALVKAVATALRKVEHGAAEMRVATPGGRFQVRWDESGSATALGQLAFFTEFLEVSGLFGRWRERGPMAYTSPNAPKVVDVLGTWLVSILDGQRRYAHVTGLRGDEVAPQVLGMKKIISDESLRRGLAHLAPNQPKRCRDEERAARTAQLARSTTRMDTALSESCREALRTPWILDTDTSVNVLYGHQAGAEIGYNPTKPGRPSHTLHTYWISNLRLVLDVEEQGGKACAAKHSLPRLRRLLDELTPEERPVLVRGDIAFGNERVMAEMEDIAQRYLFKLKQTPGVKRLIERLWRRGDWQGVSQGFDAAEGALRLVGWSCARRVVVVRRRSKASLVAETRRKSPQQELQFPDHSDTTQVWEYAVLVTNTDYRLEAVGQLYRDRADAESALDELKNQWGWGGYTTHDLHRCQLAARAVALIHKWWSLFARLAHPEARREAITSRPWLMSSVGRKTEHAGQTSVTLTGLHAHFEPARAALTRVAALLQGWVVKTAEQLTQPSPSVWHRVCDHLKRILAGIGALPTQPLLKNYENGVG